MTSWQGTWIRVFEIFGLPCYRLLVTLHILRARATATRGEGIANGNIKYTMVID